MIGLFGVVVVVDICRYIYFEDVLFLGLMCIFVEL